MRINRIKSANMKYLISILLFFTILLNLSGQTDREFWFGAPEISNSMGDLPATLRITALYETDVTIDFPAKSGFEPYVIHLMSGEQASLDLNTFFSFSSSWETVINAISPNGFHITSTPGEIAVYYDLGHTPRNRDFFSMKGKSALGTSFNISTQNWLKNYPSSGTIVPPYNGFVIVATSNNTEINIMPNGHKLSGHSAPIPDTITITLDRGETYAFRTSTAVTEGFDHLNGIDVESDKDIAISIYDDAIYHQNDNYSDLFADQIVPKNLLGNEYLVTRGAGADSLDIAFITALSDGTTISVNGTYITTINKGDVYRHYLLTGTNYAHITTNQPAYVNHLTSIGEMVAGAIVPAANNCKGSFEAISMRSDIATDYLRLRIIGQNDTIGADKNQTSNNFYLLYGNALDVLDTTKIPSSFFAYNFDSTLIYMPENPTTNGWFMGLIQPNQTFKIYNTLRKFHAAIISGGPGNGPQYAYITDFDDILPNAGIGGYGNLRDTTFCNLSTIQLTARGGNSYVWTSLEHPDHVNLLSDDSTSSPYFSPDTSGVYRFNVSIESSCHPLTNFELIVRCFQMPSSNFIVDQYSICSGDTLTITNTSNRTNTKKMEWSVTPDDTTFIQALTDTTFTWILPDNTTNSIIDYTLTLTSFSEGDYCFNSRPKNIAVKPGAWVDFGPVGISGCAPLNIDFNNLTVSGHDTLLYLWDFGDESYSNEEDPSHTFYNNKLIDSTYYISLTAETPYGCSDTDTNTVTVHPRLESIFSLDTNISCSPLVVNVDPSGSIGADTLIWRYNLPDGAPDSIVTTLLKTPFTFTRYDTSVSSGPDTLSITLVTANSQGCYDTSSTKDLIVYPNITAGYSMDKNNICDGDSIEFSNTSDGYKPVYEWTFGDNTFLQDTIGIPYVKKYFNRTDADSNFTISLRASSLGLCSSTFIDSITVHPYINANFGFSPVSNCSPLVAQISNTSIKVDTYLWNFGDGNTSDTSVASFDYTYLNPLLDTDTSYTIKLSVSNTQGCVDSISRSIIVPPEIMSSFNIAETSVCSPDSVHFQNNSTGKGLTYSWQFGNGLSGTESDSTFSKYYTNYSSNDTILDVVLTSKDANGCIAVDTQSVEILAYIDADFLVPNVDSCAPFTVRLTNNSSPGAQVFNWDFGPAGTSTDFEPAILPEYDNDTSLNPVSITIKLSATSDASHWGICDDSDSIEVTIFPQLNAEFDLVDTVSCNPFQTAITNLSSPTNGTLYEWYLDDLPFSTKADPGDLDIENFTSDSLVQVLWLYGNTQYGCRDTASKQVIVYPRVNPQFTINKEALCTYDSIYIDRSSSEGGIETFDWDFSGDTISDFNDINFYYSSFDNPSDPNPITKIITLTATDETGKCTNTWQDSVQIYPRIEAGFSVDTHQVCHPYLTVFQNNSTNDDFFSWEFGDGLSSREDNPEHTYSNFSTTVDSIYYPELIVWSQYNCYDTIRDTIVIHAQPKAEFRFPVSGDCPPFEAEMINTSTGDGLEYSWDFGGYGSSSDTNATFIFSNTSPNSIDIPIFLYVESENGCKDFSNDTITVFPNVDTNLTVTVSEGCSPLRVDFLSTADETNIQQISWYKDDGIFARIPNPSTEFDNPLAINDTVIVKFKVYSIFNCVDSNQVPIVIYPSPEANFIPDPVTVNYNTVLDETSITFTNETKHQDTWDYLWEYGDGNSDNHSDKLFTHNYGNQFWGDAENEFKIPVTLTGWNRDYTECWDSITYEIIISPPEPEVDVFEDISGCQPFTVDFEAYTKYNNEGEYYWEFGAEGETSTEESPTYTFTEAGSYTVRLTVNGDLNLPS